MHDKLIRYTIHYHLKQKLYTCDESYFIRRRQICMHNKYDLKFFIITNKKYMCFESYYIRNRQMFTYDNFNV